MIKKKHRKENVHNHYLDKRGETMKNTHIKVKVVFGDILWKEIISQGQKTKLKFFQLIWCDN